jgi:hypothetical protein
MGLPSIAQMVNQSNSGHLSALRNFAAHGHGNLSPTAGMGSYRGFRTVADTLLRWECTVTTREGEVPEQLGPDHYRVIQKGTYVTRLTGRGAALLAALEARETEWLRREQARLAPGPARLAPEEEAF